MISVFLTLMPIEIYSKENQLSRLIIMASIYHQFRNQLAQVECVYVVISIGYSSPHIFKVTKKEAYRSFAAEIYGYSIIELRDGYKVMIVRYEELL